MPSPNSLQSHRLSRPQDFENLARKGKKIFSGTLLYKHVPSPDGAVRLAFVVRKKCGNAVFRNRVRRILRHQMYAALGKVKEPRWGMIQFLGTSKEFHAAQLHADTAELLGKLGWA